MPYHVTEPHPSVSSSKKSTYIFSGRGGAGNIARYDPRTLTTGPSATGPASLAALPSPPQTARAMLTGRGGAGNAVRPTASSSTASVRPSYRTASSAGTTATAASTVTAGSAGSYRSSSESEPEQRAIFSFDEELARDQRMLDNAARTPVYHIGRGGAGNAFSSVKPQGPRKGSGGSVSSAASGSSDGSARGAFAGVVGRISRTLSRN